MKGFGVWKKLKLAHIWVFCGRLWRKWWRLKEKNSILGWRWVHKRCDGIDVVRVATVIINSYNSYKNMRDVQVRSPWYATLSTDGRLSCLKSSSDTCERHKQPPTKITPAFPNEIF
jgi:hypothetical protein